MRARQRSTAAEIAPSMSLFCSIKKSDARDKNQFSTDHSNQTKRTRGMNNRKTKPGCVSADAETNPARMAAPTPAIAVAKVKTTRSRFSPTSERRVGLLSTA